MRFLTLFLFSFLIHIASYSQVCNEYIGAYHETSGDRYFGFRQAYNFATKQDAGKLLKVGGFMFGDTLALVFTLGLGEDCTTSDASVLITFSDGTNLELKDKFGANCQSKLAVFFSDTLHTMDKLSMLRTKRITTIQALTSKGMSFESTVDSISGVKLYKSINCLSSYFGKTPAPASNIANKSADSTADNKSNSNPGKNSDDLIFTIVEEMPYFDGGMTAMAGYISKNLKVPKGRNATGNVYVQFLVSKDGSISEAKVIKGISPAADAEAVRVVSTMPKWIPGKQNGRAVNCRYVLPIKFR